MSSSRSPPCNPAISFGLLRSWTVICASLCTPNPPRKTSVHTVLQQLLDETLQGEQVLIGVLGQQLTYGVGELEEVLGVPATGPGRAHDLPGDHLQGGGAKVVGVITRTNVQKRVLGLRVGLFRRHHSTGLEDMRGGME
ncbi:hypothetical protein JZ751_025931 [Albula glossodonta]|uniref:Uncharacterized protein n=1 Tax=Albula glossodonta TaxID=121402 RepID=A0A8T2NL54_9TELE|nr:hypothetical protein JZ751_025931 [Albula glossodonta]